MRHKAITRLPWAAVAVLCLAGGTAGAAWWVTTNGAPNASETSTETPWTTTPAATPPSSAADPSGTATNRAALSATEGAGSASPSRPPRATVTATVTQPPAPVPTRTVTPPPATVTAPPRTTAPPATGTPTSATSPPVHATAEAQVVALFNAERAKAGLKPLTYGYPGITSYAQDWAEHMDQTGTMVHHSSIAPYRGEVIAYGYTTAAEVVAAWMNSPPHKAIILDPALTEVGVGESGTYWCADFL